MSDLMIRRNRSFTPPAFQSVSRTEKQASSAPAQKTAAGGTGLNISDTLRDLMNRIGQAEGQMRESRGVLQQGQAALDEVKDSLDRLAELARESAEGEEPDREALQGELEKLTEKIDRILSTVTEGERPLFLDGKAELIEGILSGEIDLDEVMNAVRELLDKLSEGLPPEQVLETLNAGSPLLSLLAGIDGMNLDLLMGLLTALQSVQPAPEMGPEPEMAAQAEGTAETAEAPGQTALQTLQFGTLQVTGRDLSGVTFHQASGEITVAGEADVTITGTPEADIRGTEQPSIRLAGSGQVTLQNVQAPVLTADAPEVRLVSEGENQLGQIQMEKGAVLTLEGGGVIRTDAVRGDASNLLRLTGGALILNGEEPARELAVPVVVDGPALFAAQAASVRNAVGKEMEPADLLWKTLLPGWSSLTELEVDGKQARQSLLRDAPARLWLDKGDPNHGYTVHTLFVQGKEESGRPRARYAFLRWEERSRQFREVDMYPNPFSVTGGEAGEDWVYEEAAQTLRILSAQVTAVSGGMGTDANQEPFSGRIVLADHLGVITLTLEGVECQVAEGKAFDLGRDNQVILMLASGSSNRFESGEGWSGISMGEDTLLNIGYDEGPAGTLKATIGTEIVPQDEPEEEGIPLRLGGGTVTLPQFHLSARTLRLDMLRVSTREYAQASMTIVDADRRWVSQIQAVYQTLYSQLERSAGVFSGGQQAASPAGSAVRDIAAAGALMEDVKRTIHLKPEIASYLHSRRGQAELHRLLK